MHVHVVLIEIALHIVKETAGKLKGLLVKDHEIDVHILFMLLQEIADGMHGRGDGDVCRTAEDASRNQGKRHRVAIMCLCKRKRILVACSQELTLPVTAAPPDWAYRVDDRLGRQPVPRRDEGRASSDIANLLPCGQEFRPRRPMDGPVHPAAYDRPRIRRIDNSIHLHLRDIIADDG